MNRVVGKCSICGGRVTVPDVWMGINPPIPQCENCYAFEDTTKDLPVVPMKPRKNPLEKYKKWDKCNWSEDQKYYWTHNKSPDDPIPMMDEDTFKVHPDTNMFRVHREDFSFCA